MRSDSEPAESLLQDICPGTLTEESFVDLSWTILVQPSQDVIPGLLRAVYK